ncbi:hypothetical protein HBI69_233210 [Parastagonospora nodorum]|nr:hypothetical protein HBI69_233210 [Parastagonospora nodorum]
MIALIGTVLYNAIKEYHDDGTRKTIHFHGHTVEDNYNAIREKRLSRQRQDYNRAGKREDNILTVDECRTGHSNEEDIEADERENKGKGWSIVTDSTWDEFTMLAEEYTIDNCIIHALALTKDKWELEPEDCNALVERYKEEINCSDLYSTV